MASYKIKVINQSPVMKSNAQAMVLLKLPADANDQNAMTKQAILTSPITVGDEVTLTVNNYEVCAVALMNTVEANGNVQQKTTSEPLTLATSSAPGYTLLLSAPSGALSFSPDNSTSSEPGSFTVKTSTDLSVGTGQYNVQFISSRK